MSSPYQKAIQSGYSPEEISKYLSKKDPRFNKAIQSGYSPEEVSEFLSQQEKPPESIGSSLGRQIGRSGARAAETVLGAPRAFGEFLEGLVPEKRLMTGAKKLGLEKGAKTLLETTKKYAPYKLFPKSEDIRENVTKHLFGEKLEPKNKWEEKADEFISDFAALTIPMPGAQLKLLKPGLIATGANLVKEGVGYLGGTEKQKSYAKIGAILTGSLINPKSAEKLKNDLYSQAKNARPSDANVKSVTLEKNLDKFEKQLLKGDPNASSKSKSIDLINNIRKKIDLDKIEIEELEEFKRNINEARASLYEEFKSNKPGRKLAKRNLDQISGIIDKSLKEYGKVNPEWESFYRPANEVHGAIAQSHKARNWITRNAKKVGFLPLLAEMGLYHYGGAIPAAAGAGAAAAGFVGAEIATRFMKSPTLRKHYFNVVNSALKEDAVAVHENLKKLDQAMKEESNPRD